MGYPSEANEFYEGFLDSDNHDDDRYFYRQRRRNANQHFTLTRHQFRGATIYWIGVGYTNSRVHSGTSRLNVCFAERRFRLYIEDYQSAEISGRDDDLVCARLLGLF